MLQALQSGLASLTSEQQAMRETLRPDLSPVLAALESVRISLATMSQEVEISREVVVKRADVTGLSQSMQNAWELMNQTKAAINKVDYGQLLGDVRRAAGLSSIARRWSRGARGVSRAAARGPKARPWRGRLRSHLKGSAGVHV